jgi:hypothetical protein
LQEETVMAVSEEIIRELVVKLRALPPERVAQVRDFIEFLRQREVAGQGDGEKARAGGVARPIPCTR